MLTPTPVTMPPWQGPGPAPQWYIDMWAPYVTAGPPSFVPGYEEQHVVSDAGGVVVLNRSYFADKETADALMVKLGADYVAQVPYQGAGGTESSDAKERWLVWRDGTAMNAGLLADCYTRNPESTAPSVAENECLWLIQEARQENHKLPSVTSAAATKGKAK